MRVGQQPELRPSVICSPRSPNKPRECTGKCRQFSGFGLVQTGSGPGKRWFKSTRPDHFSCHLCVRPLIRADNLQHAKERRTSWCSARRSMVQIRSPRSLFSFESIRERQNAIGKDIYIKDELALARCWSRRKKKHRINWRAYIVAR